ncbi:MAG: T9SS type A sorting domain-containing protein [Bacteroidales bacterium]|nr:T9SS type A sorting domain-containing protein [Bacteroidales bacterium]MDZ4203320.1 T9SS type A sorting domain-containing protein [Bacteroidales bacterium]
MKKVVFLIVPLILSLCLNAQDFAPVGALWHYNERSPNSPHHGYMTIRSVEEVMFQGKLCRKLVKVGEYVCMPRPSVEYVYSENGVVYFWDGHFNEFQVLYNFNTPVGGTWTFKVYCIMYHTTDIHTAVVTSKSTVTINNQLLNTMNVTYIWSFSPPQYNAVIYERLGNVSTYMFMYISRLFWSCDYVYAAGLRCYQDPVFGFYTTNPAIPCTYINTSIAPQGQNPKYQVFPNPAYDLLNIVGNRDSDLVYQFLDSSGRVCKEGKLPSIENTLDISDLLPGFYLLRLADGSQKYSWLKIAKIK